MVIKTALLKERIGKAKGCQSFDDPSDPKISLVELLKESEQKNATPAQKIKNCSRSSRSEPTVGRFPSFTQSASLLTR